MKISLGFQLINYGTKQSIEPSNFVFKPFTLSILFPTVSWILEHEYNKLKGLRICCNRLTKLKFYKLIYYTFLNQLWMCIMSPSFSLTHLLCNIALCCCSTLLLSWSLSSLWQVTRIRSYLTALPTSPIHTL